MQFSRLYATFVQSNVINQCFDLLQQCTFKSAEILCRNDKILIYKKERNIITGTCTYAFGCFYCVPTVFQKYIDTSAYMHSSKNALNNKLGY